MSDDPLQSALKEISPELDPEIQRLINTLLDGNAVEDAWQSTLQRILDEA